MRHRPEAVKCRFRLWDATTGRQLAVLGESRRARESNWSLAWPSAPTANGSSSRPRNSSACTTRRRAASSPTLGPPEGRSIGLLFSPDGNTVRCHLWAAPRHAYAPGRRIRRGGRHLSRAEGRRHRLAFSADGSRLATIGVYPDNDVRLWETGSGKLIRTMAGHTNTTWGLGFSPDGKRLASASIDQTGRLWDGETGQPIAVLRGHTGPVWDETFSPDGTRLVTASEDHTLRLWDAGSGDLITVLRGHRDRVGSPMLHPRRLAAHLGVPRTRRCGFGT